MTAGISIERVAAIRNIDTIIRKALSRLQGSRVTILRLALKTVF
jgi:hypothetical protein